MATRKTTDKKAKATTPKAKVRTKAKTKTKIATTRKTPRTKASSKNLRNESRKKGGYKTTLAHREAVEKYDKNNTQSIRLKLNDKTDKDILNVLNRSGNKQGLIKKALRSYKGKTTTKSSSNNDNK